MQPDRARLRTLLSTLVLCVACGCQPALMTASGTPRVIVSQGSMQAHSEADLALRMDFRALLGVAYAVQSVSTFAKIAAKVTGPAIVGEVTAEVDAISCPEGVATLNFADLPPGPVNVVVNAFDTAGHVMVWQEESGVSIVPNQTVTVTMECQAANGSLVIAFDCPELCAAEPSPSPLPTPTPTPTPDCAAPKKKSGVLTETVKVAEAIPLAGVAFVIPTGVAKDSLGNLYVAEGDSTSAGHGALYRLAPDGTVTKLTWPRTPMNRIHDIAVDRNDNVYVSNPDRGWVVKFAPGSTTGTNYVTGLAGPRGLAVGPDGALYVAEQKGGRVSRVDLSTGQRTVFLQDAAKIRGPFGLAFDSRGQLFVSNFVAGKYSYIVKADPSGNTSYFVGNCLGHVDGGADQALFNQIFDLAVDENDHLIATDYGNRVLRRITPSGQVATVAITGSHVVDPFGIITEPSGRIYYTSRRWRGLQLLH